MKIEDQWTVYRTRFLVRARQLTEPLLFTDILGREQSGRPGDYLVETSEGVRRITTKALFEDIYVPLLPVNFEPARKYCSRLSERRTSARVRIIANPSQTRSDAMLCNFPTRYTYHFRATMYGVSLLTGTIYGSTLSIPEHFFRPPRKEA